MFRSEEDLIKVGSGDTGLPVAGKYGSINGTSEL
jgi:hypothetical protein